jgi:RNA polymerase sporulation-specific sigma factor
MIKDYKKYDDSFNTKFTTYAFDYIIGEMKKYIRNDRSIKVSRDISSLYLKIDKVKELLTQKFNREPTTKEISSYLEIDENYIVEALKSVNNIDSLDSKVTSDSKELNLYDFIKDESKDIDLLIDLNNSLNKLNKNDLKLIKYRYYKDLSQSQTAELLGMSQVQVSRNEKKIIKQLKTIMQ